MTLAETVASIMALDVDQLTKAELILAAVKLGRERAEKKRTR